MQLAENSTSSLVIFVAILLEVHIKGTGHYKQCN